MSARAQQRRLRTVAGGLFAALLAVTGAGAATDSGGFPPALTLAQQELARIGQGTAYYARIIPVYDIALYAGPAPQPHRLLDPAVAKRLEIVYRVDIEAADLVRAAEQALARQHAPAQLARCRPHLDALHARFRDVRAGDRYALSYLPQRGLWLEFNGAPVVDVADAGFATLYFGIWLGENPLSEAVRAALLPAAAAATGTLPPNPQQVC